MVDLINETLDFNSLPTFVPNRNTHYRSNFMHVPSSELTAPIMKGVDHDNRPFLLFKYHLRSTGELNQFAWSTMLLGSTYAHWLHTRDQIDLSVPQSDALSRETESLRNLLHGTHPYATLATNIQ